MWAQRLFFERVNAAFVIDPDSLKVSAFVYQELFTRLCINWFFAE